MRLHERHSPRLGHQVPDTAGEVPEGVAVGEQAQPFMALQLLAEEEQIVDGHARVAAAAYG